MARAELRFGINPLFLRFAGRNREFAALVRAAMAEGARFWRSEYLPLHFRRGAQERYRGAYTRRTARYVARKARRGGGGFRGPMVWSGRMSRTLMGPGWSIAGLEREGVRVQVQLRLPYARAANLWRGRRVVRSTGEAHDFHREITATSAAEERRLVTIIEAAISNRMEARLSDLERHMRIRRVSA